MQVKINLEGNLGYSADQVGSRLTLGELLCQLEEAVERFGEDAEVVTFQTNNRYGACYGKFEEFEALCEPVESESEED